MSKTGKIREVFALLCARVPKNAMSRRELLESASALVDLHEAPADDARHHTFSEATVMCDWASDIVIRRHGWRLLSEQRGLSHSSVEAEDSRHEASWAKAKYLMEHGL